MTTVMRVSRENQYEILLENDNDWAIKNMINNADNNIFSPERIACQGTSGSYSHLASTDVFPDSYCVPVQTFEDSITLLLKGDCELALLPLENTTAGTVNDVYDLITKNSIYIVKAVSVPIHHKLVVLPGANISKIRTVLSHPQALAQCSNYIKNKGWTQIAVENTAFAAQKMIEINDPSYCAIASSEAATINNLKIHDDDICDSEHNQTRFVALSKKFIIEDNADRISLSFKLPHQSGSLASVLNVFAERGLNMTKIQSRPVPERPWEYSFWVDLSARRGDENVLLALYQLSKELPFLQILGWYEECRVNR
jgi:chorismate mutase/prephenate dehydratase